MSRDAGVVPDSSVENGEKSLVLRTQEGVQNGEVAVTPEGPVRCSRCESEVTELILQCDGCKQFLCDDCCPVDVCARCNRTLCEDCNNVAANGISYCEECNSDFCYSCFLFFLCEKCSRFICEDCNDETDNHIYVCDVCENAYCLAEGSLVSLTSGLSRPIETLASYATHSPSQRSLALQTRGPSIPSWNVPTFSFDATSSFSRFIPKGTRPCLEVMLLDGQRLRLTPNHQLLVHDLHTTAVPPSWKMASQLLPTAHALIASTTGGRVLDDPRTETDSRFSVDLPSCGISLAMPRHRDHLLALARLFGAFSAFDGCPELTESAALFRSDIRLVCSARRSFVSHTDNSLHHHELHHELHHGLHQDNILETFHNARQLLSSIDGPTLFGSSACPKSLRREFVAAWWGVTSISPRTQRARCCSSSLCRSIHRATRRELSAASPMRPLIHEVFRCHHVATIASPSGVGLDLRNRCESFFHFFDTIGTRYSPSLSHEMTLLNLFFRSTLNASMLEKERFENDDTCFATAQSLFDDFFARYLVTFPNASSPTLLMPIISVEPLPEPLPVYDLSVPQHRNFVVSSVVVHNCDECMFVGICDACSHAACRDCMISPDQQLEPCFECNSVSCKKCIFDGKMPSRMRCYDCGSVFCVTCVRKKKSLVRRRCESETCDRKHWLCAKEHRRQKDMLMHPPGMKLEAVQQHNAQLCQHHHHQQQEILAMMQVSHASSTHSSPTRQQGQHPLLPPPSSVSAVAPQPQPHPHTHTAGRHHDHGHSHRHDSPRTHSPTPGGHVHDADCSHAPPPPSAAHAKLGLEEILTQMGLGNLKNRLFNDGLRITNIHLLKEHDLLDYGIQPAAASTALSELTAILQSYPSLFPSYAPPDPALSAAPHRHASQRQPRAPSVPTHIAPVARPAPDPVAPAATSSHTADAIPKLTPVPLIDRIADRKRYPELNSNTIKYSKCDGCTAVKQCLFHCDFLPLSLSSSSSTFSSSSSGKETTTPKM